MTHAQALLATGDGVIATGGDACEPEAILADPALATVIDLTEPVCLLLVSMLHFFTADEADMIVGAFCHRMVPGSSGHLARERQLGPPRGDPERLR